MRLVVLNECFLSEDNLAYLRSVGELNVFTDTNDEETAIARLKGKDIALSDMYECPLNSRVLQQADCLKLLCLNTTGYDRVDLEAAALRNVRIANAPGASTESVAEHTFALLLSLSRHLPEIQLAMKQRPFTIRPSERAHYNYLGFDLLGKIIGIIGVGAIGAHVANIARGFGMHVLGYTPTNKGTPGVESVSLNELCARSDVITLHLPLNKQSRFLIDTHIIAKMKRGVVVINTARGQCISSKDLAVAIERGEVAGAGLDDVDCWSAANPLFQSPRTIITPHSAWFTKEALAKIGQIATENVRAFVEGHPQNIVSPT